MTRWPLPTLDLAPRTWPEMLLYATTIYLEAAGESDTGKLGVAWVIRNRSEQKRLDYRAVILAPWHFPCWLDTAHGWRKARLVGIEPVTWDACWWAACGAHWDLIPDPTQGCTHYLNPDATREGRPLHDLPNWYDPASVVWKEGRHEFLRLV